MAANGTRWRLSISVKEKEKIEEPAVRGGRGRAFVSKNEASGKMKRKGGVY
jgi:hypothetical protein